MKYLFGAGLALAFQWQAAPRLSAQSESVAQELPSVLELQRDHLLANGGRANLEEIQTLRVRGEIVSPGAEPLDFKIFRKRPGMMRLITEYPRHTVESIANRGRAIQRLTGRDGKVETVELSEEARLQLLRDSEMDGAFYRLRGRDDVMTVEGFEEIGGRQAIRIAVDAESIVPYTHIWLDAEHYQEVMLRSVVETAEGEEAISDIVFDDFTTVSGIWFPRQIRYLVNGEFHREIRIDDLRINVGIFDSYFSID